MLALAYHSDRGEADLVYKAGRLLASGQDLETAVLISLFTDAPALPGDDVSIGTPRRGWWADFFEGSTLGSRLWLIHQREATPATAQRGQSYAQEALTWLVDDGHVKAIEAASDIADEAVLLDVAVILRDGNAVNLGPFKVN